MSQKVQPAVVKKTRICRSTEIIAELILEAERKGNAAEICRRERIQPNLLYRWKSRFKEVGVEGLKAMKRRPKGKDPEKTALEREKARLKAAMCESLIELQLLKNSVSAG